MTRRRAGEEELLVRSVTLFKSQWEWLKTRGTYSSALRDVVSQVRDQGDVLVLKAPDASPEELKAAMDEALRQPAMVVSMPAINLSPEAVKLIESKAAEHKMEIEDFLVKVMQRVAPPKVEPADG